MRGIRAQELCRFWESVYRGVERSVGRVRRFQGVAGGIGCLEQGRGRLQIGMRFYRLWQDSLVVVGGMDWVGGGKGSRELRQVLSVRGEEMLFGLGVDFGVVLLEFGQDVVGGISSSFCGFCGFFDVVRSWSSVRVSRAGSLAAGVVVCRFYFFLVWFR